MTEHTPTTGEVRDWYQSYIISGKPSKEKLAEFDRWLQSVKAQVWEEAEFSFLEWVRTKDETLYTAPENPYK